MTGKKKPTLSIEKEPLIDHIDVVTKGLLRNKDIEAATVSSATAKRMIKNQFPKVYMENVNNNGSKDATELVFITGYIDWVLRNVEHERDYHGIFTSLVIDQMTIRDAAEFHALSEATLRRHFYEIPEFVVWASVKLEAIMLLRNARLVRENKSPLFESRVDALRAHYEKLTEREAEIMVVYYEHKDMSRRSLAAGLGISEHTLKKHTRNILASLDLKGKNINPTASMLVHELFTALQIEDSNKHTTTSGAKNE